MGVGTGRPQGPGLTSLTVQYNMTPTVYYQIESVENGYTLIEQSLSKYNTTVSLAKVLLVLNTIIVHDPLQLFIFYTPC